MTTMLPRLYTDVLKEHLRDNRQMAFVAGPRQVGKTTLCRSCATLYLDWDNQDHRAQILAGPARVADRADLARARRRLPVIVFDELHKYSRWKTFLKGFFDTYEDRCRIIVIGSSRLDVYRRGGDSLMGRYFLYRMHPLSVGEILEPHIGRETIRPPRKVAETHWKTLWKFGGFPEPFSRRDGRFSRRWQSLRRQQLIREDVRDLTRIQDIGQLEILGRILDNLSGERIAFANLASEVRVSQKTVQSWVDTFCTFHHGFLVRPWFRNVQKGLRKEPKWFLRDWSGVADRGKRAETFVANHLLKAVETWTDLGLGDFELRYIRDKMKREVDFAVIRDGEVWILVEVKAGDRPLSPSLAHFQKQTRATFALQVGIEDPFVDRDFRDFRRPTKIAARTFLSQLP